MKKQKKVPETYWRSFHEECPLPGTQILVATLEWGVQIGKIRTDFPKNSLNFPPKGAYLHFNHLSRLPWSLGELSGVKKVHETIYSQKWLWCPLPENPFFTDET